MPIWFYPTLLALCAVASLAAGIWLMLHLQALAHLFAGTADVRPAPSRPRASRKAVIFAVALFNAGWIASIVIWAFAIAGYGAEIGSPLG
ncbi:hypothetical protein GCM10011371_14430 [Novosphingobium marinum]|uniref:Uncharacterized protein n=1 Tax=Novosphingobium marinum TaxID=1514948 RepID=A0A7Z0BT39_9SPHN|nr:hypothetical protein [Novosphingobium marinum]NYH95556.1 hypothetical protein [Novosphingobium marinum]GGC28024.1 hypothetical protein GCM10011371_14430 [Novosphingobium marinum]